MLVMGNHLHIRPAAFNWKHARLQHRDCLPHLRQGNSLEWHCRSNS